MAGEGITFSGVVLAGGRSTRMGTDKAFLEVDGERMLDRQIRLLREAGAEEVFLSGRREIDYGGVRAKVIHDRYPDAGPLAGVVAALERSETTHLIVLAVDLPRMESAFLRRMAARCVRNRGVVPQSARGWEPLCAVYPKCGYESAKACLERGTRSPSALVGKWGEEKKIQAFEIGSAEEPLFFNWNAPRETE